MSRRNSDLPNILKIIGGILILANVLGGCLGNASETWSMLDWGAGALYSLLYMAGYYIIAIIGIILIIIGAMLSKK